jgi:hypothetical protein
MGAHPRSVRSELERMRTGAFLGRFSLIATSLVRLSFSLLAAERRARDTTSQEELRVTVPFICFHLALNVIGSVNRV